MNEHKASRTLVKSPPELWAECSDASSLTRHLDQFGDITITKLEPESTVAWEGERASGTVRIEPSGWGTRVTLTASVDGDPASAEEHEAEPERVAAEPQPAPQRALGEPQPEPEPIVASAPESVPPPVPPVILEDTPRPRGVFARLLDFFGLTPAAPPPGPPAPALSGPEAPLESDPEPEPAPEPEPDRSRYSLSEVHDLEQPELAAPEPVSPDAAPAPEMAPVVADLLDAEAALIAALDSLGQAHHRPFSRA